jgi:hypothetical protein
MVPMWSVATLPCADRLSQEGTLDAVLESKRTLEFYAHRRLNWVAEIPGAEQQSEAS